MKDFLLGNYTDSEKGTGVTVILSCEGAVGGVSVRGAAPGTRETDLLKSGNLVDKINAVVLSGGSAFGLDACSGVVRYLHEKGFGYKSGKYRVPIVCGAVIFDLEYKEFGFPSCDAGYVAASEAKAIDTKSIDIDVNSGVGAGATVGKMLGADNAFKGGLGIASVKLGGENGVEVMAIVAVNALGDIYDEKGDIIAGVNEGGEFLNAVKIMTGGRYDQDEFKGKNTTIGCILTDAELTKEQANRLADIAHDGLAIAIRPVHTMFDGDTMFAMASGTKKGAEFNQIATSAVEVTAAAIRNAVKGNKLVSDNTPKKSFANKMLFKMVRLGLKSR